MLPHHELLEGSQHRPELEAILGCAEQALRTWQPCWTSFLDGDVREEAESRLGALADLSLHSEGGFAGAERRRLLLQRQEPALPPQQIANGLMGLEISGNFLFDPCSPEDFRHGLITSSGADADGLGDFWLRGDRGAQAVATAACAQALDGRTAQVRSVEVQLLARPLEELQLPTLRHPKRISCVEASRRLDALASAGFGLSRSRMAERIRLGELRINWQVVTSPSRELAVGDRVQWSGRGELQIEEINLTKRERWRIQLMRC